MRKFKFFMPLGFLLIAAGFSAIVMLLWNWLMPSIFGLITINFWQALGILALARILFGRGGKMLHKLFHNPHHNHIHDKWAKMSPEQRREFIEKRRKFGFEHARIDDFFGKEFHNKNKSKESDNNDD